MFANNRKDAWNQADRIFPTDYELDLNSTLRAGYDVYRSRVNRMDYICDLGSRLELNFADGRTVNIRIA